MESVAQFIQRLKKEFPDPTVLIIGITPDGEEEEIHIFENDGKACISIEPRSFGTFKATIPLPEE